MLKKLGVNDPLLDIAKALEERALADDYFIERKLYPNVDFYTGVIYRAMGFPTKMFTVLFALGRLPGWIAHWREMINDPENRIGRPRQLYAGPTERAYVADAGALSAPRSTVSEQRRWCSLTAANAAFARSGGPAVGARGGGGAASVAP